MSKIEWTQKTWNPIVGCSIKSPGCINCYAQKDAWRFGFNPQLPRYKGLTKLVNGKAVWTGELRQAPEATLLAPLRRKTPTTYFVNSMSDLFHEDVPDEWIDRIFAVMALTPQHTYQCLTKRSDRMRAYCSGMKDRAVEIAQRAVWLGIWDDPDVVASDTVTIIDAGPLPNVWLGVSTERQQEANERIPDLLATPAAIRFISAEPLLGPIDLERVGTLDGIRRAMPEVIEREERGKPKTGNGSICGAQIDAVGSSGSSITFFQTPDHMGGFTAASPRQWPRLDWVIVGGESGPDARPMHPDWARSLRNQCTAAGISFFFKQWGAWRPEVFPGVEVDLTSLGKGERVAANPNEPGTHIRYFNVGKEPAGRVLDGLIHDEYPEAAR